MESPPDDVVPPVAGRESNGAQGADRPGRWPRTVREPERVTTWGNIGNDALFGAVCVLCLAWPRGVARLTRCRAYATETTSCCSSALCSNTKAVRSCSA